MSQRSAIPSRNFPFASRDSAQWPATRATTHEVLFHALARRRRGLEALDRDLGHLTLARYSRTIFEPRPRKPSTLTLQVYRERVAALYGPVTGVDTLAAEIGVNLEPYTV
jgi:hypothetical protein